MTASIQKTSTIDYLYGLLALPSMVASLSLGLHSAAARGEAARERADALQVLIEETASHEPTATN